MEHYFEPKTDFIFGIRAVIEAINFDKDIDKIIIRRGLRGDLSHELMALVRQKGIPFQMVPDEKLNRITAKNHQGVVAFMSAISFSPLEEIVPRLFETGQQPLLLALDGVSDVRNFGAIVRSAECAGVHAVIIPEKGSARIGADAIKTSAGALLKVPVCRVNSMKKALQFLQMIGIQIMAATEKGARYYFDASFLSPACIVMGSEDTGISDEVLRLADALVKIPVLGKIESLNVSVAASVLIYEAVRQRHLQALE
jgi:23S rRNA (guanosine2251-2'-O)-methyltransferase